MAGKLGFGMMRLPLIEPENDRAVDMRQVERMVDAFIERGFTYFDTAYMYHDFTSECVAREALVKRHARDSFTLASKLPTMFLKKEDDQERIFGEQLVKCGVDYFDYYLLHSLNGTNYATAERLDSFAFVARKKAEGRIRHVGFSFHDRAELLDEILTAHPETEFVQLQINYLDWDNESIQSRMCYEVARRHGKQVVVMEPVKGGALARVPAEAERLFRDLRPDLSPASWAIRYAASLDGVMMVLSGMSSLEQLLDNTSYMQSFEPLSDRERAVVTEAVGIATIHVERIEAAYPRNFAVYELLSSQYGFKGDVCDALCRALSEAATGRRFYAREYVATVDRGRILVERIAPGDACEVTVEQGAQRSYCGNMVLYFETCDIDDIRAYDVPEQVALLDADLLRYPLRLRRWREGDTFIPFGMEGRKKVSDYLIDRKVSLPEKQRQFVLLSGGEIVWLVGRRIDDRYRLTDRTENVLRITKEII